jgi:hypothetical protein
MKSLFWKELRQLAPWSAAMLVAMSAIMIGSLMSEAEKYYDSLYQHAVFQVWLVIAFGTPCVGFIIGVLQTVLEVRRDQWAFLMHRGLSPTQIFLTKVLAGVSAYSVVTLVPMVLAVVWCRWGGIERQPLTWFHLLPLIASWLASLAYYLAAILAVVWKGPWYFSRVLPLVSPILMSFGVVGYASEVTEFIPIRIFVAIALAIVVLAVAAWGVFVRSGESARRAGIANFSIGIPVFVAMFGGCLCLFAAAGAFYEWLGERYHWDDARRFRPFMHYTVNRDGHVLQVSTRLVVGERGVLEEQFVGVVDLDEPQSDRYSSLAGQSRTPATKNAAWDPLPMGIMYDYPYGPFEFLMTQESPRQILENFGSTVAPNRTSWLYSLADGWIYGYRQDLPSIDRNNQRRPPSLEFVAGPDGFHNSGERPLRRFGKLLAHSGNAYRPRSQFVWQDLLKWSGMTVDYGNRYASLFDDGLYLIDTAEHVVRPIVSAGERQKIRCVTRLGEDVAVVYEDSVAVHSALPLTLGKQKDISGEITDNVIDVPGALLYSFPIPQEVAQFGNFSFGRLPASGNIVFTPRPGLSTFDLNRFVEMRVDGTVVRSRDFLQPNAVLREAVPVFCAVATFAPPGPTMGMIAINEIQQAVRGDAPGTFGRLFRSWPPGMVLPWPC